MPFLNFVKKFLILLTAGIIFSFATSNRLHAQGAEDYLKIIAQNTTEILKRVNNIPVYINKMTEFAISWLTIDDSDETAAMQASFAALGQGLSINLNIQNSIQKQLAADLVDQPIGDFNIPANAPKILSLLPNINDIMYPSMVGLKPAAKGPFSPYNFIKNAGGLNFNHDLPRLNWQGGKEDKDKYKAYYDTVIAVESFNTYALSNLYAESINGNQTTKMQNDLAAQASSSSWIAKIATQELGKVLRQMLIFQSQTYVLLTQLVQTQKQLLTATVMTNTLLISNNRLNEMVMTSRAKGVTPRP